MSSSANGLDYQLLFESAPGLYLVLTPDLTIAAASDAYLTATMTQRERIVGRPLFEVFPDSPDDASATGVRNLTASLQRVLKDGVADVMAVQKYPIRRPEEQGGGFEERYWSPVNSPVFGPSREVAYILHRVEDVTEFVRLTTQGVERDKLTEELQLRTERMEADVFQRAQEIQKANRQLRDANDELTRLRAELERRSELLLQAVLDNAFDAIVVITERGQVEIFNAAAERMFGYGRDEAVGQNVKMLMPEPHQSEHDGSIASYLRTGVTKALGVGRQVLARKKDGATFPIDLGVSEFVLGGDRYFIGVIRDLTEHRKLEAQLNQAQKMEAIGLLAGGVAHDFNNLLTIISGYGELIQANFPDGSEGAAMVKEIRGAGDRATSLTRQLLAFSRQQVLEPHVLDFNAIITHVEKMLRRLIGEDIDLALQLAPDLELVKADPGQIDQVVLNLAVNARDAMPEGGKLTIETRNVEFDHRYVGTHPEARPGRFVQLAISDNGCGMSPEIRARVFEPFFTTKGVGKGTGLGLSVVHGIVKQSGGTIEVYSEVGVGTSFKIHLPAVREAPTAARLNVPPAAKQGSETILLVEDESAVRELAAFALRQRGYVVLTADDGVTALDVWRDKKDEIDLLVTDVVMREMGGRKLAELVLADDPAMKVLYLSGYTDDAVVRHGILQAEFAFLQKPFTPNSLAQKVRDVLDR